jgi:hypothetical protein
MFSVPSKTDLPDSSIKREDIKPSSPSLQISAPVLREMLPSMGEVTGRASANPRLQLESII